MISSDLTHDHNAAKHYRDVAVKFFSSAAQYKSKEPAADISLTPYQLDLNFFGSEHGKDPSDGECGVLNKAIEQAVTGRQAVLNNAADVFKWCETNMVLDAPGSKRHFHFVPAGTIQRNRPETDVQPLKGIRMLHQIRNVSGHLSPVSIVTMSVASSCMF